MVPPPRPTKRRQAAALVVQSFIDMAKKSTAQPRPQLHVPPRGIGPIQEPNDNDVLCGRGGRINAHEGNVQFRDLIAANKKFYLAKTTKKLEKAHIAARIVELIRSMNPPGRFLKEDPNGLWFDIGDAKAIKKAGQALREDAPDIRDSDDEGDETLPKVETSKHKPSHSPVGQESGFLNSNDKNHPTFGAADGDRGHVLPHYSSAMPLVEESARHYDGMNHHNQQQGIYNNIYEASHPQQQHAHSIPSASLYNVPRQLYDGVRNATKGVGTVSKRALEALSSGHVLPGDPTEHNQNEAFGRHFTPTVMSSGSDAMSTISGISGVSQGNSHLYNVTKSEVSALSMGSNYSLRQGKYVSQLGYVDPQQPSANLRASELRVSGVSDLTYSFKQFNGMVRSRSYGELSFRGSDLADRSVRGDVPMSDASIVALLSEENEVNAMYDSNPEPWGKIAPLQDKTRTTSTSSMSKATLASPLPRNRMFSTSAMSIASIGSNSDTLSKRVMECQRWDDDRSLMSDISGTLLALDLATGNPFT